MKKNLSTDDIQKIVTDLAVFLEDMKKRWDMENPEKKSWYKFNKTYLVKSTIFLLNVTDELIQFVEEVVPSGPTKKALVLSIVAKLFDYISIEAYPIWLRPFVPAIKELIVSVIISNLVEFIVSKYKAGYWKMEPHDEATTQEKQQN